MKSRQKNVETVETAIFTARKELDDVRSGKAVAEKEVSVLHARIATAVADTRASIDLSEFNMVDDKLRTVRDEIYVLRQQRQIELQRDTLESALSDAETAVKTLKLRVNELEAAAERDIDEKRQQFEGIYTDMMRRTIPACRTATLDADYAPMINGGEYREASAAVPRRLLYYATLLQMSRMSADVSHPRFLLIDTPQTAGIDEEDLLNALDRLDEVVQLKSAAYPCQVILTTGVGKYPKSARQRIIGTISRTDQLLKIRSKSEISK